jgi:NADPH-dependent curcumin reductase CurA
VITDGALESLNLNPNVYALRSYNESQDIIVLHNLSDQEVTIEYDFTSYKIAEQVFNGLNTKAKLSSTLTISAYNTVVLIKK